MTEEQENDFRAKYARQIAEAVIDLYKSGVKNGIDMTPDCACVVALAFNEYVRVTTATAKQPAMHLVRICRQCGCTDDRACVNDGIPCHWVDHDLCSACAVRK